MGLASSSEVSVKLLQGQVSVRLLHAVRLKRACLALGIPENTRTVKSLCSFIEISFPFVLGVFFLSLIPVASQVLRTVLGFTAPASGLYTKGVSIRPSCRVFA